MSEKFQERENQMSQESESGKDNVAGLVGWSARGLFFVGVSSVLVALVALIGEEADFDGAGLCLIAAALGFGLLLNGMLRK